MAKNNKTFLKPKYTRQILRKTLGRFKVSDHVVDREHSGQIAYSIMLCTYHEASTISCTLEPQAIRRFTFINISNMFTRAIFIDLMLFAYVAYLLICHSQALLDHVWHVHNEVMITACVSQLCVLRIYARSALKRFQLQRMGSDGYFFSRAATDVFSHKASTHRWTTIYLLHNFFFFCLCSVWVRRTWRDVTATSNLSHRRFEKYRRSENAIRINT